MHRTWMYGAMLGFLEATEQMKVENIVNNRKRVEITVARADIMAGLAKLISRIEESLL